MKGLPELLSEHPFFKDFAHEHLDLLAGCARNIQLKEGGFLFREGEPADQFFIVRGGRLNLEMHAPGRGHVLSTHGEGDILGWSWIFPPYRWTYDCRALSDARLTALDGKCLREKCEQDNALGYQMMKHFSQIMTQRLQATRLQLMDLYGAPS